MSSNKSVLIVDDHAAVRVGLIAIIDKIKGLEVIAEAGSGEEAYEIYTKKLPDILVIDISMPGVGGMETLRKIRARGRNTAFIVYTMHDEVIHVRKALEAGAMAYVLKSENVDALILAFHRVMNSQKYLSEEIAQKLALESVYGRVPAVERLTAREYEVFCFLAKGMRVSQIADLLAISSKTVATYQTQLKHKLNINNSVDLVRIAMKAGIL